MDHGCAGRQIAGQKGHPGQRRTEMIAQISKGVAGLMGKSMVDEGTNAVLMLALSGTIAVLVARGNGSLSSRRLLSAVLSDPVARREPMGASYPTLRSAVAV